MINNFSMLTDIPGWFRGKGDDEDVVVSTRVRLSRNLTGFLFPNKMELKDEKLVKDIIIKAFKIIDNKMNILHVDGLNSIERRMMAERSLISQNFILEKDKTLILSKDQKTACMVNENDHLLIAEYRSGLDLLDAYNTINRLEIDLEKILDFAVSLEFGYLNENISNSGTGLKVSIMLHLPALVRLSLFDRAIKSSLERDFAVKGYLGNDDGSLGDLYQISNGLSIGNKEEEYIEKLASICKKLVSYERQARDELLNKRRIELEDKYHRSIGLIKHCRLLTAGESVNALTDIRLGIVLGWSKIDIGIVNSLFLLSQKAHIQYLVGSRESDNLVIDSKRADLLRVSLGFVDKMEDPDV